MNEVWGQFVNLNGSFARQALQFVDPPAAVAFQNPYILNLHPSLNSIFVYSSLFQAPVQLLDFEVGGYGVWGRDAAPWVETLSSHNATFFACPLPFSHRTGGTCVTLAAGFL